MSAVGGAGGGRDELVDAYIRHLANGEEAPNLDLASVEPGARAELEETFTLLDAIAGIDPDLVPEAGADPVAQALGFEAGRGAGPVHLAQADEVRLRIAEEIHRMHRGALVAPDEEAALVPGARSDLLVRVAGVRIRVAAVGAGELAQLGELLAEADRLFYRFPETAAVALVAADDELTCQLVEAQDCRPAVEVPAGTRVGPHPRHPQLPLRTALESYLDDIEPIWDEPDVIGDAAGEAFDVETVAAGIATAVVRRLADEGSRARIAAKRTALAALGDPEIAALARLVVDVSRGRIAGPGIDERLAVLVGDAA
ncbi:MAG TPA: hypothetical protein VII47_03705 [Actinomycetota bacterium]|jgi:hypothetical protein